ncbi:MAG: hypothetical protein AAFQ15_13935 [Pseudomonadota bacterium]
MNTKSILLVWWTFFWRATLAGLIAGAIVGFIAGVFLALAGQEPRIGWWVAQFVGFVIGIPVSMWAFLSAINHDYKRLEVIIRYKEDGHDLDNNTLQNRPA